MQQTSEHTDRPISVSAVIPTHGRDDLLRQAVASAVSQSGPLVEVVVVDDVGSAATRQAVESLDGRGRPVRYLHNEAGAGASSSRNLGAQQAVGSHVAFLDDDDLWLPGYVQRAVEALVTTGRPVVFTQLDHFADNGRPLPLGLGPADVLATNPGVSGSSILMRREEFLALGGFDSAMWVSNDKDFLVRLLDAGLPYAVVPEPLVHWRTHQDSRLTRPSQRRLQGLQAYYAKYEHRLSWRDKRKLRGVLVNTQRHMATRPADRAAKLAVALLLLGPGDYTRRLLRTTRRQVLPGRLARTRPS